MAILARTAAFNQWFASALAREAMKPAPTTLRNRTNAALTKTPTASSAIPATRNRRPTSRTCSTAMVVHAGVRCTLRSSICYSPQQNVCAGQKCQSGVVQTQRLRLAYLDTERRELLHDLTLVAPDRP